MEILQTPNLQRQPDALINARARNKLKALKMLGGMWADRPEMSDVKAHVQTLRQEFRAPTILQE